MDHFAGLDVSVKETSICIVDDSRLPRVSSPASAMRPRRRAGSTSLCLRTRCGTAALQALFRLRRRLPFACALLRLGTLGRGRVAFAAVSLFSSLRCRTSVAAKLNPHVCADEVLRHATALGVHEPEVVLSDSRSLGWRRGDTTSPPRRSPAARAGHSYGLSRSSCPASLGRAHNGRPAQ
jgi:hypothetical protein